MKPNVGKIVAQIAKVKDKSPLQIAQELHTERRNVYNLLKKEDMEVHMLWRLSEILGYNFFADFHPVEETVDTPVHETIAEYQEKMLKVMFNVEYPMSKAKDLGEFLKQVHLLANKMGFKMV